eukprot:m.55528 g.55528  ORF g.55528 m.55528 type:complete len:59 (-) comp9252_c0_seq2:1596-1772(-)
MPNLAWRRWAFSSPTYHFQGFVVRMPQAIFLESRHEEHFGSFIDLVVEWVVREGNSLP